MPCRVQWHSAPSGGCHAAASRWSAGVERTLRGLQGAPDEALGLVQGRHLLVCAPQGALA